MNVFPPSTQQWRFAVPAGDRAAVQARRAARAQAIADGVSRRRFVQVSAGTAGLLMAGGAWSAAHASDSTCAPRPIPHTIDIDGPGGLNPIHILLPGVAQEADADPSTITDFVGEVGYAIVDGTGWRIDRATHAVTENPFEVDLRFMRGVFIAGGGRTCHGTFALI